MVENLFKQNREGYLVYPIPIIKYPISVMLRNAARTKEEIKDDLS